MPTISTSDGKLFYAQRGAQGPPLVCIHGAGGTHRHWGYQLRDLVDCARVYALDLPGHGRSGLFGRATVAEYAAALLAFLDACGLEQAVLAGHSLGGAIALWLALEHPQRVLGLGLVGSAARLRVSRAILRGLAEDSAATIALIAALSYAAGAPAEVLARAQADYANCDLRVYRGDFVACQGFDVLDRLGELRCPVTIVCGANDRMVPPVNSAELQHRIANAELSIIPQAGHMPMIEQPAATSAALRQLIGAVGQ